MLLAGLLERAGFVDLERRRGRGGDRRRRQLSAASCAADMPTRTNLAKQLAWSLLDRLPVIEGSGFLAAVARRWKTQFNENSNSAAAAEELPEATHNTVVGYDQPETMRDHQYVVFLDGQRRHRRATASGCACRSSCSRHRASIFSASRSTGRAAWLRRARRSALATTSASTSPCCTESIRSKTEALTLVKQALATFDERRGATIRHPCLHPIWGLTATAG